MTDLAWAVAWGIVAGALILLLILLLLMVMGGAVAWAVQTFIDKRATEKFLKKHIADDDPYADS